MWNVNAVVTEEWSVDITPWTNAPRVPRGSYIATLCYLGDDENVRSWYEGISTTPEMALGTAIAVRDDHLRVLARAPGQDDEKRRDDYTLTVRFRGADARALHAQLVAGTEEVSLSWILEALMRAKFHEEESGEQDDVQ